MKKWLIVIGYCMFTAIKADGQMQANNWYFGQLAGISFNSNPPQGLQNGGVISDEGCASISDGQGRLLFYTSGISIINRAHLPMKNGNNLMGDQSSTQGVIIVPQPGNDSIYFVFTNGAVHQLFENGLRYSVVNIRGDNGMGEVLQKNVSLLDNTYERIAAVRHCNNQDIWVLIRKWESDQYYAYLVTATGVNNTPVTSSTGFIVSGDLNRNIGNLKFSSKGDRLACAFGYSLDRVELMDFNRQTGRLTSPVIFNPNNVNAVVGFPGVYGIEFSPDGRLLYANVFNDVFNSSLFQFNIVQRNAAAIEASRQMIHNEISGSGAGSIQVAVDGKLYVAYRGKNALSVIENPNLPGQACNFRPDAMLFDPSGQRRVNAGLPNFIQSYFDAESNVFDFLRLGACDELNVFFRMNNTIGVDSVRWQFGDGGSSVQFDPSHAYAAPGFYNVTLTVYKQTCSGNIQSVNKKIWIAENSHLLDGDKSFCLPGKVLLQSTVKDVNFLWNTNAIDASIEVSNPGLYWLEVENYGCSLRDSVMVSIIDPPLVNLGPDTSVCSQKPVLLDAGPSNGLYLWSTGETSREIRVTKPGDYAVTITTAQGCTATDSVSVLSGDCGLFIPGAFSPNGDGLNDTFGPVDMIQARLYKMTIYNRYGQTIFQTDDPGRKWDGSYQNKQAPIGLYIWVVRYAQKNFLPVTEKGTVLLIR